MTFYEYCPELVDAVKDNALESIEELLKMKVRYYYSLMLTSHSIIFIQVLYCS